MLRRNLEETVEFLARQQGPDAREIFATLREHWPTVLCGALLGALTTAVFNLITVYTPTFGRAILHLSAKDSLLVTLCVGLSNFIWLPIGGLLSDHLGRRRILLTIAWAALLSAYPAFAWLVETPSFPHLLGTLLLFSCYYGCYNGAMVAALTEIMPERIRVMGFSLAFSLSTALFGGITLAISTYLIDWTGDKAAPGYWMSFAATCSLLAAWRLFPADPAREKSC